MNPLRLASGNQETKKKIPRSGIRVCFSHSEEAEEAADGEWERFCELQQVGLYW